MLRPVKRRVLGLVTGLVGNLHQRIRITRRDLADLLDVPIDIDCHVSRVSQRDDLDVQPAARRIRRKSRQRRTPVVGTQLKEVMRHRQDADDGELL